MLEAVLIVRPSPGLLVRQQQFRPASSLPSVDSRGRQLAFGLKLQTLDFSGQESYSGGH